MDTTSSGTDDQDTLMLRALNAIDGWILRRRLLANLVIHTALFAMALLMAYLVRFDGGLPGGGRVNWFSEQFLIFLPFVLAIKLIVFARMNLFRTWWRSASVGDAVRIVIASWWCFAIIFIVAYGLILLSPQFEREGIFGLTYSRGVVLLDFFFTVVLVSAARLSFRLLNEEFRPISSEGVHRVIIAGAGHAAEVLIREIQQMNEERYRVIGLVDDDADKQGLYILGLPVLGKLEDLPELCEDKEVEEILIAIPSATRQQLRRLIELCRNAGVKFRALPGVGELMNGQVSLKQVHDVDINDLLGRDVVNLDRQAIGKLLAGRRVLVTGAGGSIGSEMCRQIAGFGPAELVLLEQAENPLFEIAGELTDRWPTIKRTPVVCDICDRQRVMEVFDRHRPEVVIHAAAHKHVPLMEANPCEALKNNIFGTINVADAACEHQADDFVMISTDKAVNPSSIMGATKRVAELYVQELNHRPGCRTQFKAVRFGNVLGSAGSVVPIFKKQIARGGPVTVTHPEMTRYFMTIPEASQLVLQAAVTGCGGQVFLLDMGEPVRIVDLARDLITLSGLRPEEDIKIEFTGIRPGEKLFEKLRIEGEDIEPTDHEKVRVWRTRTPGFDALVKQLEHLRPLMACQQRDQIVQALQQIVPEYRPQGQTTVKNGRPSPEAPASPAAVASEDPGR